MNVKFPNGIATKPLAELTPYAKNARTHSDEQIEQLCAAMLEFGFTNPVLIDAKGSIIAGHGRVMAAERLGLPEVPVIVLDHLSDQQRRALVLADNKLAENSGWDLDILAQELKFLDTVDYDIDVIGFADVQVQELLAGLDSSLGGFDDNTLSGSGGTSDDPLSNPDTSDPGNPKGETAPEQFPEFDEDIQTEHQCPSCGYKWSSSTKPYTDGADDEGSE